MVMIIVMMVIVMVMVIVMIVVIIVMLMVIVMMVIVMIVVVVMVVVIVMMMVVPHSLTKLLHFAASDAVISISQGGIHHIVRLIQIPLLFPQLVPIFARMILEVLVCLVFIAFPVFFVMLISRIEICSIHRSTCFSCSIHWRPRSSPCRGGAGCSIHWRPCSSSRRGGAGCSIRRRPRSSSCRGGAGCSIRRRPRSSSCGGLCLVYPAMMLPVERSFMGGTISRGRVV